MVEWERKEMDRGEGGMGWGRNWVKGKSGAERLKGRSMMGSVGAPQGICCNNTCLCSDCASTHLPLFLSLPSIHTTPPLHPQRTILHEFSTIYHLYLLSNEKMSLQKQLIP